MRRLLRWLIHTLVTVMLLLGLACLIAWPVSYWRTIEVSYQQSVDYRKKVSSNHASNLGSNFSIALAALRLTQGRLIVKGKLRPEDTFDVVESMASLQELPGLGSPKNTVVDSSRRWYFYAGSPEGKVARWFALEQANVDVVYRTSRAISEPRGGELMIPIAFAGGLLLAPGLLWFLRLWWVRRRRVDRLNSGLCLHCGYNLTGVEADRCPECGAGRPTVSVLSRG